MLRFTPLSSDEILHRLHTIAGAEHIEVTDEVYSIIVMTCNGDLKLAINYLQVLCSGGVSPTQENYYRIFNLPSIRTVTDIITGCMNGNGVKSLELLDRMIDNGYNTTDIMDIVIKVLTTTTVVNDTQRVRLLEEAIKTVCMCEQTASTTQLYGLIARRAFCTPWYTMIPHEYCPRNVTAPSHLYVYAPLDR